MQVGPAGSGGGAGGGGTATMETPTGAVDGENNEFVFIGTPVLVMRNGVAYGPDAYSVVGTTVTITVAPLDGEITGLTTS